MENVLPHLSGVVASLCVDLHLMEMWEEFVMMDFNQTTKAVRIFDRLAILDRE